MNRARLGWAAHLRHAGRWPPEVQARARVAVQLYQQATLQVGVQAIVPEGGFWRPDPLQAPEALNRFVPVVGATAPLRA